WSACSRCTRRTSTRSPWCVAARSAVPSFTISASVGANPPASPRRPLIAPSPPPAPEETDDEKRHSSRLSLHRDQADRRHHLPDAFDLRQGGGYPLAGDRSFGASRLDRRDRQADGHRRPRLEVQEEVRRP